MGGQAKFTNYTVKPEKPWMKGGSEAGRVVMLTARASVWPHGIVVGPEYHGMDIAVRRIHVEPTRRS